MEMIFYFIEELLKNKCEPKVLLLEYNAKFIPPAEFVIDYDPKHEWKEDDYFGASLMSWVKMLEKYNYKLICCNASTGCKCLFYSRKICKLFS